MCKGRDAGSPGTEVLADQVRRHMRARTVGDPLEDRYTLEFLLTFSRPIRLKAHNGRLQKREEGGHESGVMSAKDNQHMFTPAWRCRRLDTNTCALTAISVKAL